MNFCEFNIIVSLNYNKFILIYILPYFVIELIIIRSKNKDRIVIKICRLYIKIQIFVRNFGKIKILL